MQERMNPGTGRSGMLQNRYSHHGAGGGGKITQQQKPGASVLGRVGLRSVTACFAPDHKPVFGQRRFRASSAGLGRASSASAIPSFAWRLGGRPHHSPISQCHRSHDVPLILLEMTRHKRHPGPHLTGGCSLYVLRQSIGGVK